MSRDQIEKMAKVICKSKNPDKDKDCPKCVFDCMCDIQDGCEALLDEGYRKASDVAEEIFAEIEKIIDMHYNNHIFGNNDLDDLEHDAIINFSDDITCDIDELKKKYTEEGK